jgi:multisubunit Na+/H+ antiporter MnhB subunit
MERIDWLLLGIALLVVAVLAVWFLPNFETVCRPL